MAFDRVAAPKNVVDCSFRYVLRAEVFRKRINMSVCVYV